MDTLQLTYAKDHFVEYFFCCLNLMVSIYLYLKIITVLPIYPLLQFLIQ